MRSVLEAFCFLWMVLIVVIYNVSGLFLFRTRFREKVLMAVKIMFYILMGDGRPSSYLVGGFRRRSRTCCSGHRSVSPFRSTPLSFRSGTKVRPIPTFGRKAKGSGCRYSSSARLLWRAFCSSEPGLLLRAFFPDAALPGVSGPIHGTIDLSRRALNVPCGEPRQRRGRSARREVAAKGRRYRDGLSAIPSTTDEGGLAK